MTVPPCVDSQRAFPEDILAVAAVHTFDDVVVASCDAAKTSYAVQDQDHYGMGTYLLSFVVLAFGVAYAVVVAELSYVSAVTYDGEQPDSDLPQTVASPLNGCVRAVAAVCQALSDHRW